LSNETPTELCIRLEELFQELRLLPGDAAVTFIDTQQIGYLVNALRHEKEWDTACSAIQSAQIKGDITFKQACDELRFRCEASRANELTDKSVKGKRVKGMLTKAKDESDTVAEQVSEKILRLISTMSKRQNTGGENVPHKDTKGKKQHIKQECLAANCSEMTTFPLCSLHYHSLVSAKCPSLKLRTDFGEATFNPATSLIVYPPKTPAARLPSNTKKVLKQ
jgi:hypothetical protein